MSIFRHDDDAKVAFRGWDSFIDAIVKFVREGNWDLHDLPLEFDGTDRTSDDLAIARQQISLAKSLPGGERRDALRFGMWLLSDSQSDEIAVLLSDDDEYVRRDAHRRLEKMIGSGAKKALESFQSELEHFAKRCENALVGAGVGATVHYEGDRAFLVVEPGPVWLNVDYYFSRRSNADMLERLVADATSEIKKKAALSDEA